MLYLLNEAIAVAENRPLWRLVSSLALCTTSGACLKKISSINYKNYCSWIILHQDIQKQQRPTFF